METRRYYGHGCDVTSGKFSTSKGHMQGADDPGCLLRKWEIYGGFPFVRALKEVLGYVVLVTFANNYV